MWKNSFEVSEKVDIESSMDNTDRVSSADLFMSRSLLQFLHAFALSSRRLLFVCFFVCFSLSTVLFGCKLTQAGYFSNSVAAAEWSLATTTLIPAFLVCRFYPLSVVFPPMSGVSMITGLMQICQL